MHSFCSGLHIPNSVVDNKFFLFCFIDVHMQFVNFVHPIFKGEIVYRIRVSLIVDFKKNGEYCDLFWFFNDFRY